jgi:phage-related protein
MPEQPPRKPLEWMGSSRQDLRRFPEDIKDEMGFGLDQAQLGRKHLSAKPLKGFCGASVLEIVEDHDGNTYRAVYTVKFNEPYTSCTASRRNQREELRRRSM